MPDLAAIQAPNRPCAVREFRGLKPHGRPSPAVPPSAPRPPGPEASAPAAAVTGLPGSWAYALLTAQELGPIETRPLEALRHYNARWAWPPGFTGDWSWETLRDDMAESGIREPLVILTDGQVIDGGHRLDLARQFALDPVPVRVASLPLPLSDTDQLRVEAFAVWSAIARRQLTRQQITALVFDLEAAREEVDGRAVRLANLRRGTAPGEPLRVGPTAADLAKATGLSPRYVEQILAIAHRGTRALREQVRRGDLSVRRAYRALRAERPGAAWQAEVAELAGETHALIERAFDLARGCGAWPAAHRQAFALRLYRAADYVAERKGPFEASLEELDRA